MILDSYYYHSDTITAIAAANDDTFLVTGLSLFGWKDSESIIGTKSGECAVWIILSETQKLSLKALLFDHTAKVNEFNLALNSFPIRLIIFRYQKSWDYLQQQVTMGKLICIIQFRAKPLEQFIILRIFQFPW